jgi:hypothetical protein
VEGNTQVPETSKKEHLEIMIKILVIVFILIPFLVSLFQLLFAFTEWKFLTTKERDNEMRMFYFMFVMTFIMLILVAYFWR